MAKRSVQSIVPCLSKHVTSKHVQDSDIDNRIYIMTTYHGNLSTLYILLSLIDDYNFPSSKQRVISAMDKNFHVNKIQLNNKNYQKHSRIFIMRNY